MSGNTSGSLGFYPEYGGGGAGLYNSNSGTSDLSNCTISDNTAYGESGGGVENGGRGRQTDSVTLTNCTVSGNTAGNSGGGVYTTFGARPR
jgi:predicted outer membrane repeat protein